MTITRLDEIQAGIIAYLKSRTNILAELSDTDEIREDQWQGTEFSYPAIRLMLSPAKPFGGDCYVDITGTIYVFSENASSQQADRIAGIIANEIDGKTMTSTGVNFTLWVDQILPAVRQDLRTWRSGVMFRGSGK
jgi:hypothetical protein